MPLGGFVRFISQYVVGVQVVQALQLDRGLRRWAYAWVGGLVRGAFHVGGERVAGSTG